ncbi:arsenate-mycothiol transferase ArsC [Ornithinimicrobium panacihumi]|uniref:arsenate-mycothiol transferase ArsC n=1 Tax=Ornithinimicrobium panacihumi TaxID=2008449 RepID=UPI003F89DFBB
MELSSTVYESVFARVTDQLVHRFGNTFSREQVETVVRQGRAQMEAGSHHPEFIPSLIEHWARDILTEGARDEHRTVRPVPEVVFVCEHNAGRSQLAAALAEHLSGEHLDVRSAGVSPERPEPNPAVVQVLAERGVELECSYPAPDEHDAADAADVLVLMGVPDNPGIATHRTVTWKIADPHHASVEVVREIAADVERHVRELLIQLEVPLVEASPVITPMAAPQPAESGVQAREHVTATVTTP